MGRPEWGVLDDAPASWAGRRRRSTHVPKDELPQKTRRKKDAAKETSFVQCVISHDHDLTFLRSYTFSTVSAFLRHLQEV
jgi:hypothetical protein